jgi:hypothetical protein
MRVPTNRKTENAAFMMRLGVLCSAKYPCYINYGGGVEVDFELCPRAEQVDEDFKAKVKELPAT